MDDRLLSTSHLHEVTRHHVSEELNYILVFLCICNSGDWHFSNDGNDLLAKSVLILNILVLCVRSEF